MINFTFRKSGTVGVLTLSGELTKQHAVELRTILLVSLDNSESLLLNFEKVIAVDSFCCGILYSASLIALRLNKHFRSTGAWPEMLHRYPCFFTGIQAAAPKNQVMDQAQTCLWLKEEVNANGC